jgi:hypothetical protein
MSTFEEPPGLSHAARLRAGAGWLALLAPLFFVSYGLSNRLAASRDDVPSVVFGWEHQIPFIPWTIIPYWSIDLLYAVALFVFGSRKELRRLAHRLILAQLIAVVCFLAYPLRFTFSRPETDGFPGWLFQMLSGFDLPYNQAPSLHIALLVILWVHFHAHIRPVLRPLLHGWFLLIGLSVLTTYQHHFIDVPTGLWLGWFCVWLLPHAGTPRLSFDVTPDSRRRQLAGRYAAGAVVFATLALVLQGVWLWFLWPAGSLALVAAVYLTGTASALGKRTDGRIEPAAIALLWPYMIGIWINARLRTWGKRRVLKIADDLWLSALPSRSERKTYPNHTIVDLTPELPGQLLGPRYHNVPMLDLVAPKPDQLQDALSSIAAALTRGPVMVCCALGLSRSATVAAAWLITHEDATVEEALHRIRSLQPAAVFTSAHVDVLHHLATAHRGRHS